MPFDRELLDLLVCPVCKNPFQLAEDEGGLICATCKLVYPIKEDTPILLADAAEPLDPES